MAENHDRLLAIVQELAGLSDELGSIDSESAAMIKRGLDVGLRSAPHLPPKDAPHAQTVNAGLPMPAQQQAAQPQQALDIRTLIREELRAALGNLQTQSPPPTPGGGG